jgi:hypothetical protein
MGRAGQGPDRSPATAGASPIDDTLERAYSASRLNGTGADDPSTMPRADRSSVRRHAPGTHRPLARRFKAVVAALPGRVPLDGPPGSQHAYI